MGVDTSGGEAKRQYVRRELVRRYLRLQRELAYGDPGSASYRATIQSFRQMGYQMIALGFEDDLDRLLRLRVLVGGRSTPAQLSARSLAPLRPVEQVR